MDTISQLQKERYKYKPTLPQSLQRDITSITVQHGEHTESVDNQMEIKQQFPHTYGRPLAFFQEGNNDKIGKKRNVGVVLSGGQAPGGHNVIAGIYDGLNQANPDSKLYGFLGGPGGILENKAIEITPQYMDQFRNTGGFDMIGSGRTKLEKEKDFERCLEVFREKDITALVIIGGDDSNTNAALLAEYIEAKQAGVQIIGVPKTIDGDLKSDHVEASFGFDTATKIYSELIGNIERDANSAKKYWHFVKLMGRSASHIALECTLKTHPNYTVISEEIEEKQTRLDDIVSDIVDTVVKRSENGDNFGVVVVPEGLIEFIPEMRKLISELNNIMAEHSSHFESLNTSEDQSEFVNRHLSMDSSYAFSTLPTSIQRQLLMDRDPHGNVQVSRIETEKLLIELVSDRLKQMKNEGKFKGKFSTQSHFFGYEGRSAFPSNFDANYCYALGYVSFLLIGCELTGYMAVVKNLSQPAEEWVPAGVPITMMMNLEQRKGKLKPVIKKALVDINGKPFKEFARHRDEWGIKNAYVNPGAIQYFGPDSVCNQPTVTLELEHS
jgi:pyrophosphate--fructose-6-phosphate 1-phosphotransferase